MTWKAPYIVSISDLDSRTSKLIYVALAPSYPYIQIPRWVSLHYYQPFKRRPQIGILDIGTMLSRHELTMTCGKVGRWQNNKKRKEKVSAQKIMQRSHLQNPDNVFPWGQRMKPILHGNNPPLKPVCKLALDTSVRLPNEAFIDCLEETEDHGMFFFQITCIGVYADWQ